MTCNEKTFNDIYSSYNSKIFNLSYKITGDKTAAEDITQETFLQVYEKYGTFKGESHILTWIYTIAKNNCLKYLNKTKRTSFRELEELINSVAAADDENDYNELEKQVYIEQVKEGCLLGLLRCLSYYQRVAFILHILYHIPVTETGVIIDKSPNAVRILLHRARTNLKHFLCKNCSLYDHHNPCKCENLISFSLSRGWIRLDNSHISSGTIERELKTFRDEARLYQTLRDHIPPASLTENIKKIINDKKFHIFSEKKVK